MRILGPPSAPRARVLANLAAQPGIHPRFTAEMFGWLSDAALAVGVDPVGLVAQAFKETGGGKFGGLAHASFKNTCGLKQNDEVQKAFPGVTDGERPLAHATFPSWQVGALAHAQHVAAYAGQSVTGLIVDPRYDGVVGKYALENWEDFGGGRWAPSVTYGAEVVVIARRLQTA